MRWKNLRRLAAVLAIPVLLLAACGDDDDDAGGSATTTTEAADSSTSSTVDSTNPSTTAPATTTGTSGSALPNTDCAAIHGWGVSPRESSVMMPEELYQVDAAPHEGYDRVVFDINGTTQGDPVGYSVSYVEGEVSADASGEPVPTEGDAALQVVVRAPIWGTGSSGHQPGRPVPQLGDSLLEANKLASLQVVQAVAYAGSFEGQTTIAVGVTSQRPFCVGSFERDGYSHVYVDIAY